MSKAFLIVFAIVATHPDGTPKDEIPLLRFAFPTLQACYDTLHTVEPAITPNHTSVGCFEERNEQ